MENSPPKFNNKYRIKSTRLEGYDYSSNGAYFVTICTKNKEHFLGKIENSKMKKTAIGEEAEACWKNIPRHFPFVELGEFVIMPNHVHGIIIIMKEETKEKSTPNRYGAQSKNLASIIRGFKIGVTKYARSKTNIETVWQPRYHDHIIRNEESLGKISLYINLNPQNWKEDKLNTL